MYIYIYGSDQISAMHPPPPHPAPNYFGGGKERLKKKRKKEEKKKERKEMCNLFRACLYCEEDILNQNR